MPLSWSDESGEGNRTLMTSLAGCGPRSSDLLQPRPGHCVGVRLLLTCYGCLSSKPKDGRERFVDAPLLFGSDPPDHIAESSCVDRPHLLDQDAGCLAE